MKAILLLWAVAAHAQEGSQKLSMAEMMERAKKFTQPGEAHKLLERFVGDWRTETSFVMGGKVGKAQIGEQRCGWLMKGRWIECRVQGPLMGKPSESFTVIGYDNFKQSYRVMMVSSIDTAMNVSEGDMDPGGQGAADLWNDRRIPDRRARQDGEVRVAIRRPGCLQHGSARSSDRREEHAGGECEVHPQSVAVITTGG